MIGDWGVDSVDAMRLDAWWSGQGWMQVLGGFVVWCCRLGSDDGVVVLRFGGFEVGPLLIEVTFGGDDRLRKTFAH